MPDVPSPTGLNTQAKWRECMEPRWYRSRSLMGGTDAMRKEGKNFLPQFPEEPNASYDYRLKLAVLNNFYRRMVRTMMGYLFVEEVQIEKSSLGEEFLKNVDLRNSDLNQFARHLGWHLLTKGIALPFVDYPIVPPGLNLAQEKQLNARPYFRSILPDYTITGFAREVQGVERVMHMRWYENRVVPDGWGESLVERIRIIDADGVGRPEVIAAASAAKVELPTDFITAPVVFSVWRSNSDSRGGWQLESAGVYKFDVIPIEPIYSEREAFMMSRPPLDDVAYKNVQHWRKSSDLEHILELAAFPTPYQIGTEKPVSVVGPGVLLHSQDTEAEFGYIEPQGAGIIANERALDRMVAEAEMMGFQLLKPSVGQPQTATGRIMDETKSVSPLYEMAMALEDGLTYCCGLASKWYGKTHEQGGIVTVNKNFGIDFEQFKRVDAILKLRSQGDLSLPTLYDLLKEVGFLPRDFNVKKEVEAVEEEAKATVAAMTEPTDPNAPPDDDDEMKQPGPPNPTV